MVSSTLQRFPGFHSTMFDSLILRSDIQRFCFVQCQVATSLVVQGDVACGGIRIEDRFNYLTKQVLPSCYEFIIAISRLLDQ
jgi:hypothetical protein